MTSSRKPPQSAGALQQASGHHDEKSVQDDNDQLLMPDRSEYPTANEALKQPYQTRSATLRSSAGEMIQTTKRLFALTAQKTTRLLLQEAGKPSPSADNAPEHFAYNTSGPQDHDFFVFVTMIPILLTVLSSEKFTTFSTAWVLVSLLTVYLTICILSSDKHGPEARSFVTHFTKSELTTFNISWKLNVLLLVSKASSILLLHALADGRLYWSREDLTDLGQMLRVCAWLICVVMWSIRLLGQCLQLL